VTSLYSTSLLVKLVIVRRGEKEKEKPKRNSLLLLLMLLDLSPLLLFF
jgi:hypothetical protein